MHYTNYQYLRNSMMVYVIVCYNFSVKYFVILDDGRYYPQGYSKLYQPDYEKFVPDISYCLSLCSFNQSCAAMSYNESTSTCSMSGVPHFLNISGVKHAAYWKLAHPDGFIVTHGKLCIICICFKINTTFYCHQLMYSGFFYSA